MENKKTCWAFELGRAQSLITDFLTHAKEPAPQWLIDNALKFIKQNGYPYQIKAIEKALNISLT